MHQRCCQLGVVYRSIGDDGCSSLSLLILSWCMRRVELDEDEDDEDEDDDG